MKLLDKYINYLSVNGRSFNTIINYKGRVKKLLKFANGENITEELITDFLLKLKETKKPKTLNSYKETFRDFIIFLKSDVVVPKNARLDERLVESMDLTYFEKTVIPIIEKLKIKDNIKIKALLYFMYYTGLRVSEVANLKREDIDTDKREARIHYRKNKKPLIVYFPEKVAGLLENFFETEIEEINAFNMTCYAIKKRFQRLNKYFKEINFHPHLMRHSLGTFLRDNGMEIVDIQKCLGQKSISSTLIYAHSDRKKLEKKLDKIYKKTEKKR